jgi:hypothetical protein
METEVGKENVYLEIEFAAAAFKLEPASVAEAANLEIEREEEIGANSESVWPRMAKTS